MKFEEQFPSIKSIWCRDGILSATTFQIKNSNDYEKVKAILSEQFIDIRLVEEHCLDKQKIQDIINKHKEVYGSEKIHYLIEALEKEMEL